MSAMQPIQMLRDYCGNGNPVIVAEFSGRWRRTSYRKRASASWLRHRRAAGVTQIAVEIAANRTADFAIDELLRGPNG